MRFNLKQLLILLAFTSIIFTLVNSFYAGYQVQHELLTSSTLEKNRVYAQKLASSTDNFLNETMQTLAYSASLLPTNMDDSSALLAEADRLKYQSNIFNSVLIVNAEGLVLATSPQALNLIGETLNSEGAQQALSEQKPLISKPYTGITGRNIIFISYPIHDQGGQYLGLVGGTIYLQEENILNALLGEHFDQDGSYIYVVDEDGRIIYHQNPKRINDIVKENKVVQALMNGESGSQRVINSEGKDMLAGYAYIATAKWGVVSQRLTAAALAPSLDLVLKMITHALPFLLLSFILSWWLSKQIAKPLWQLSTHAEKMDDQQTIQEIKAIPAWYFEAIRLKKAMLKGLELIQKRMNHFIKESSLDPLTGLANRRTMNNVLEQLQEHQTPFSVIALDIDRFKLVNDTYGHAIGDEVLKFLAEQMRAHSRETDLCCRNGGEEFIILLPETAITEAVQVAERLRQTMEETISPCGNVVTVSMGVAHYPTSSAQINEVLEQADQALYQAKNTGRNRVVTCTLS